MERFWTVASGNGKGQVGQSDAMADAPLSLTSRTRTVIRRYLKFHSSPA